MANDSSSRERKVRGKKIRSDRDAKERRRAKKNLSRNGQRRSQGQRQQRTQSGDDELLSDPSEVTPDPFVVTDQIEGYQRRINGWLDANQPVHLIGPTGCGKTALALSAAAQRDRPVVFLNGDEAVDTAALVGEHAGGERYKEDDRYVSGVHKQTEVVRERWVDNPLSVAAREGATLVYNEFSRSNPVAHNVLLSVFEEGVLERPGKRGDNRQIDVHPEFRAILTSNNVEYAGVHEPQDALLDRVVGVHVDFYDEETEREIVAAHVDLSPDRIEQIVTATRALREQLDIVVGTRAAITVAKGVAVFDGTGGDDGDGVIETDRLVDLFTDVLSPKVAGRGDVNDLRNDIESTL